ncbi:MAG TPA: class I SAM-dependent methyltransferase, partial [Blastocatellia bacterium]|nr:class I SAM-dependent methyltransferase [Blastocatellia bacterium]
TYANTLLFGAAAPHRLLSRVLGSTASDVRPVPGWMNRAFCGVLRIESRLLKVMSFPFGLSAILLAEKRPAGLNGRREP